MNNNMTPYEQYENRGYSAKHTFLIVFAFVLAIGILGLLFYITYHLIGAVDEQTLRIFGTVFLALILGLILVGGLVSIWAAYAYLARPGIQGPGIIGRVEKALGLD